MTNTLPGFPEKISEEEMQRYSNPDRWEGHVIGQVALGAVARTGEASVLNLSHTIPNTFMAKSVLKNRISALPYYDPTERVKAGQDFDPNNYDPGTVIAFGVEALTVRRGHRRIPEFPENIERLGTLPVRPELSIMSSNSFGLVSDSLRYTHRLGWGVVVNERKAHALLTIGDMHVSKRPDGKGAVLPTGLPRPLETSVLRVGQTTGGITDITKKIGKPTPGALLRYTSVDIFEPRK